MSDKQKGLYEKYIVKRTDGSSKKGGKHHDCVYFVIDTTHDKFAYFALNAYAEACKSEYPLLAEDLMNITKTMEDCEPHKFAITVSRLAKLKIRDRRVGR